MIDTTKLVEIRWHGRAGQGAVTSAELLARAAIDEGRYAQAFPSFGPERRGAPVLAFDRISSKQIRVRAEITEPDAVVVMDPLLVRVVNVTSGLKAGGIIIINTKKSIEEVTSQFDKKWGLAVVDANKIAQEVLGVNAISTAILGALLKAIEVVKLESLNEPLRERFGRLGERNVSAMKRAFEETKVKE